VCRIAFMTKLNYNSPEYQTLANGHHAWCDG